MSEKEGKGRKRQRRQAKKERERIEEGGRKGNHHNGMCDIVSQDTHTSTFHSSLPHPLPPHHHDSSAPVSLGLLYLQTILYVVRHLEPVHPDVSDDGELDSMDTIVVGCEVVQSDILGCGCQATILEG